MNPDRSQLVCIPIKFHSLNQFCDIDLTNLTRESFLKNVSSVVPVASSKFEFTVYDDSNVVVPTSLLKKVITTYMHRPGFYLKIEVGKVHRNHTVDDEVLSNNAFRSYLISSRMKHIVVKGEKNEEILNKGELIELIKAAINFLVVQHGPKPGFAERQSLTEMIHKLFPQLDPKMILKKLNQRVTNVNRIPKVKKYKSRAKVCVSKISSSDKNDCLDILGVDSVDGGGPNNDYEELLTAFEIK